MVEMKVETSISLVGCFVCNYLCQFRWRHQLLFASGFLDMESALKSKRNQYYKERVRMLVIFLLMLFILIL